MAYEMDASSYGGTSTKIGGVGPTTFPQVPTANAQSVQSMLNTFMDRLLAANTNLGIVLGAGVPPAMNASSQSPDVCVKQVLAALDGVIAEIQARAMELRAQVGVLN